MASSGKITGSWGGGGGHRLVVEWTQTPDSAHQRSVVTCSMHVHCKGDGWRNANGAHSADSAYYNTAKCTGLAQKKWSSIAWSTWASSQYPDTPEIGTVSFNVPCKSDGQHDPVTLDIRHYFANQNYDPYLKASAEIQLNRVPMGGVISSMSPQTVVPGNRVTLALHQYVSTYYARLALSIGGTTMWSEDLTAATDSASILVPASWMSAITGGLTGTLTATYTTYSDSARTVQVGVASTATCTIDATSIAADIAPTVTAGWYALSPVNANTPVSGQTAYVAQLSRIRAEFDTSKIACAHDATIASLTLAVLGYGADTAVGGIASVGPVMSAGAYTAILTVTDSRGVSTTASETVTVYSWQPPIITQIDAVRTDSGGTAQEQTGTYITVTARGSISDVKNPAGTSINALTLTVSWRQAGTQAWTDIAGALTPGQPVTFGGGSADISHAWDVRLTAADNVYSTQQIVTVPKASITLNFYAGGDGACFGGYATDDGLEIDWPRIAVPAFTPSNEDGGGITLTVTLSNNTTKTYYLVGREAP